MTPADRALLAGDVKRAEGLRLKAYRDSVGVLTIGYGTNLEELEITPELALEWLHDKLRESEEEAQRFPWYAGLNPRRQRAVVEMIYNLGMPRFLGFVKLQKALAGRDYATAAREALDSKWAKDVGPGRAQRIADMLRRG